jgi:hypothetical protein
MRYVKYNKLFGKNIHCNRTICELHREIYDICMTTLYEKDKDLTQDIVTSLEKICIEGIKLNTKLIKNKLKSSSKWSSKDYRKSRDSHKEIDKRRKERIRLEEILRINEERIKGFNEKK